MNRISEKNEEELNRLIGEFQDKRGEIYKAQETVNKTIDELNGQINEYNELIDAANVLCTTVATEIKEYVEDNELEEPERDKYESWSMSWNETLYHIDNADEVEIQDLDDHETLGKLPEYP